MRPIGDERLGAVDDIFVAVTHRPGRDVLQVRSGARFGHGDRRHELAGGHAGQPPALLFFGAEGVDVVGVDRRVDAVAPCGVADEPLFLQEHRLVGEGAATAAVLFGDRDAQQTGVAGPGPRVTVDLFLLGEAGFVRHDLLDEESACQIAQVIRLLGLPGAAVSVENHCDVS